MRLQNLRAWPRPFFHSETLLFCRENGRVSALISLAHSCPNKGSAQNLITLKHTFKSAHYPFLTTIINWVGKKIEEKNWCNQIAKWREKNYSHHHHMTFGSNWYRRDLFALCLHTDTWDDDICMRFGAQLFFNPCVMAINSSVVAHWTSHTHTHTSTQRGRW